MPLRDAFAIFIATLTPLAFMLISPPPLNDYFAAIYYAYSRWLMRAAYYAPRFRHTPLLPPLMPITEVMPCRRHTYATLRLLIRYADAIAMHTTCHYIQAY